MKTTTITREFDDAGRCVKETVVEVDHIDVKCSCVPGITGLYCPIHGYRSPGLTGNGWITNVVT